MTVMQTMAKVATMEPCSKAFFRFPSREKCWNARYAAMANASMAPPWLPLSNGYRKNNQYLFLSHELFSTIVSERGLFEETVQFKITQVGLD
jgi:hypothetical protein